ncbi:MAG: formamidopyrimidine-DNA glycosylase, partial [Syntrophomonadaceae bacterium]|nr:formamidopyrimidine-DNA glycosylase [Syntrophomonadaceae bacterium]
MPELPEVETVRRSLQTIIGAKIKTIEINRADIIRKSDYQPE